MSLLTSELAFSMVHTATSSDAKPPAAEVLPMYPSTRTPASSNTLYARTERDTLDGYTNAHAGDRTTRRQLQTQ